MNQNDHIAEHLLLQYLLGKGDPDTRREIEEWLTESEANRKHLERLEVLWFETGKLVPPPVVVDTAAAWQRLSARMDAAENPKGEKAGKILRVQPLVWAAGIAAAVIIALGFWWFGMFSLKKELVVMASIEEVITDTLPDGTMVTLNKNSTLLYPDVFAEGPREVKLLGEGFFKVTHDPQSPFIVQTGESGIRVLGTSFDVRAYPEQDLEVFVSTGKVEFFHINPQTGDSASVLLTAGMKGILPSGASTPMLDTRHEPDEMFWMNQTLEFRQTPLSEVTELLRKCYHVQIELSGGAIASCKLTAFFSGEPIELILQVIADTFGLTLEQTNGMYRLTGNSCGEANR